MARRTPPTAVAPPGHAGVARLVGATLPARVRNWSHDAAGAPVGPVPPFRRDHVTAALHRADSYPDTTSTADSAAAGGFGWVQSRFWGVEP